MRAPRRPIHVVLTWLRRQPPKVKAFLAVITGMAALVLLWAVVHDHDNIFIAAEAVHSIGIAVLIYKLMKEKTCAGLSLKTQELTAMFLAVRLYCSFVMEYDIHTVLDLATLATTLWVIYMIRFNLKSTYMEDKDNFALYYVVVPCAVLALLIHPTTSHHLVNKVFWAFCVYMEAVAVLPQLRVMQNTKIIEPFTSHYVFALGVARFLSCAHWVLQVLDSSGDLLVALGHGLWPPMVLISEVVQTFILADFCYYYRFWRTACVAPSFWSSIAADSIRLDRNYGTYHFVFLYSLICTMFSTKFTVGYRNSVHFLEMMGFRLKLPFGNIGKVSGGGISQFSPLKYILLGNAQPLLRIIDERDTWDTSSWKHSTVEAVGSCVLAETRMLNYQSPVRVVSSIVVVRYCQFYSPVVPVIVLDMPVNLNWTHMISAPHYISETQQAGVLLAKYVEYVQVDLHVPDSKISDKRTEMSQDTY
nr:putative ER lumen protein-retaining receptor C28H8.4 [Ipomoea batatas]